MPKSSRSRPPLGTITLFVPLERGKTQNTLFLPRSPHHITAAEQHGQNINRIAHCVHVGQ